MMVVILGIVIPFLIILIPTICLIVYGYKHGYLDCINKDWEPGDFFMMTHHHHHDVHVDVHEHHDYWHP